MVVLPSTTPIGAYGLWVSVEGRKSNQNFPTAWGGAWFPPAVSGLTPSASGVFSLDVDTGTTYILKARAFGVGSVTLNNVVVGASDLGQIQTDNTGTVQGGNKVVGGVTLAFNSAIAQGITGTASIEGNTAALGSFTLYINAFSPSNYSYASTQIQFTSTASVVSNSFSLPGLDDGDYQIYTFLQGFEVFPPGSKIARVVNGAANLNLILKQFGGQAVVRFSTGTSGGGETVSLKVNGSGVSFSTGDVTRAGIPFKYFVSSGELTIPNLGTGFYDFSTSYNFW